MKLESTEILQRKRHPLIDYLMAAVMATGKRRAPRFKHVGSFSPMNRATRIRKRKNERLNKQKGRA